MSDDVYEKLRDAMENSAYIKRATQKIADHVFEKSQDGDNLLKDPREKERKR